MFVCYNGLGDKMKLDRLIGILTVLLQNEKTTAPELARRFEVSPRSKGRGIFASKVEHPHENYAILCVEVGHGFHG